MARKPKPVKLPRGFYNTFYAKMRRHKALVLGGRMLCIDPATGATSNPGWALSEAGVIVASGEIKGLKGETPVRLAQLFRILSTEPQFQDIDVLVVELLRGKMVAAQLHWSVGVIVAAVPATVLCECPIPVWKQAAKAHPEYRKTDEWDAKMMGHAAIEIAKTVAGPAGGAVKPGRRVVRAKRRRAEATSRPIPVEIELTQGKVAVIDADDAARVGKYKWYAKRDSRQESLVYVRTNLVDPTRPSKQRGIVLHRLIMDVLDRPEVQVDHIDGNPLNNQKANLRLCTQGENVRNSRRPRAGSGFIGVTRLPSGRWQAAVRHRQKSKYIGVFMTAREAAVARDRVAQELHGEFAVLNFA